jgi:serine/threonine-protein kinase RsbW
MPSETFAASFDNLARICEFVTTVSREAGFSEADVYDVELATNEACTNIIEHGYGENSDGKIECSVEVEDKGVTVVLRGCERRPRQGFRGTTSGFRSPGCWAATDEGDDG